MDLSFILSQDYHLGNTEMQAAVGTDAEKIHKGGEPLSWGKQAVGVCVLSQLPREQKLRDGEYP